MDIFVRISSASTASTSYRLKGSEVWGNRSDEFVASRGRSRLRVAGSEMINGNKVDSPVLNRTGTEQEAITHPELGVETSPVALNAVLSAIATLLIKSQSQADRPLLPSDPFRQGTLVNNRLVYRQTFVIRSYEVGSDRTASIETLMNHFQETALNHVWMSGLAGDGFGATRAMIRHNLIWVVTRMHVQVERYPAWGDAIELDTWVAASGKNGMRRDFLVRDYETGEILARATSTWVVMNQTTRRLSKMPEDVREEITPFYFESFAIINDVSRKITRLHDDNVEFVRSGLAPRHGDLDMNQHVNNVKYIGWMIEGVPLSTVENYSLSSLTLEYRRECGQKDVVQSLSCMEHQEDKETEGELCFIHLLRMERDGSEIVRGRTVWRPKSKDGRP